MHEQTHMCEQTHTYTHIHTWIHCKYYFNKKIQYTHSALSPQVSLPREKENLTTPLHLGLPGLGDGLPGLGGGLPICVA